MHPRFTILTLLLALLGISCQRQAADAPLVRPVVAPKTAVPAAPPAPGRPVFPYSVVSGGLTDATEMAEAVQQDPVVRKHYAGLRPASFRAETLKEDRQGYVSYRIRDKVYWTRRLMTLKKGEMVLTDGATMLRGRCGNRISPVAMAPAAPPDLEPTEAVLNSWQDSRVLAGIPPVPVASPVGATLKLDRSAPIDFAASLLIPPDSSFFGTFPPQAGAVPPNGIWLGGGGPTGGGSGGGAVGGGAPPEVPPASVNVPGTVIPPPVPGAPPILIATAPPASGLPLPPLETPYFLPTPDPGWTPLVTYPLTALPPGFNPPGSTPPGFTPPGAQPPSTNPPGGNPLSLPPNLPPATVPPAEIPPGIGGPPTSTPPTVSDPPPSFPPPAQPEDETAVPEPATVLLAASALALLGAGRYFARRRS